MILGPDVHPGVNCIIRGDRFRVRITDGQSTSGPVSDAQSPMSLRSEMNHTVDIDLI